MNSYRVGMTGPGEAIVWTLQAPPGVNLALASTLSLSATLRPPPTGTPLVLEGADWTLSDVAAGSVVATYVPDGTEFPRAGTMPVYATLTIDGVPYRYDCPTEIVEA